MDKNWIRLQSDDESDAGISSNFMCGECRSERDISFRTLRTYFSIDSDVEANTQILVNFLGHIAFLPSQQM